MKVLIQNPLTLSYFETDRKWTHDADSALDFKDSRSAVRYCSEHDLLDMEIVLKFPQERYDVHMPAWAAAPPSRPYQRPPLAETSQFAA